MIIFGGVWLLFCGCFVKGQYLIFKSFFDIIEDVLVDSEVIGDSVGLRLKLLNFVDIVVCVIFLFLDCMLLRLEIFNFDIVEDVF